MQFPDPPPFRLCLFGGVKGEVQMKTLIRNVTVLTMDKEFHVYDNGYVLMNGKTIEKVGEGDGPAGADCVIDGRGGILMPGMVNTHCHIPMIPFRSLGDDCPDRLRRFLFPLESEAMTAELVYQSTRYGVCELLLAGVTSVLDMYYFEDQVAKACDEMGIRAWAGQTVIDMETCDSKDTESSLRLCAKLIEKWKGHDRIHPVVAPHATNTNPPEVLKAAYELARENSVLYTLHVSEMDYEMKMFADTYGKSPVGFLYDLGVLGPGTVAAHCIHFSDQDVKLFAETGAGIAHCAGSNTKSGKGVCPVRDLRALGVPVGVGTDGPSSGNTLDLFTQFRMIPGFQRTKYHDRSIFTAREVVRMGTIEGAKILGAEKETGSIEPGKRADLVLVETDSVNMFPIYDPYSALVYSAEPSNVDSVWVDGVQLVKEHRLLKADLRKERERLDSMMTEFRKRAVKYSDL